MDKNRQGEIALALLRYKTRKEGVTINPSTVKREFGNLAKELDIPIDELIEFARIETKLIVEECFK